MKASATGGRLGRQTDGDVYGNYNVLFHIPMASTYLQLHAVCKGIGGRHRTLFWHQGTSQSPYTGRLASGVTILGSRRALSPRIRPFQGFFNYREFQLQPRIADSEKKKAFVESITSGNFHNSAAKGAESALSCMMRARCLQRTRSHLG